jgi:hypothetical protein
MVTARPLVNSTLLEFVPPRKRVDRVGVARYTPSSGIVVMPLNDAIGVKDTLADGSPKWVREVKPQLWDVMVEGSVLLHAGLCVYHEPVFNINDDAKDMFRQFFLHHSEY